MHFDHTDGGFFYTNIDLYIFMPNIKYKIPNETLIKAADQQLAYMLTQHWKAHRKSNMIGIVFNTGNVYTNQMFQSHHQRHFKIKIRFCPPRCKNKSISSELCRFVPVQDIEDLPAILHSTAGFGILSDGGDRAQNGCPVFSLQRAATDNHHWTLCSSENLHDGKGRETYK